MVMSSKLIYYISPQIGLSAGIAISDIVFYRGRRRESNSDLPGVSSPFSHDATEADMEISRKRHI